MGAVLLACLAEGQQAEGLAFVLVLVVLCSGAGDGTNVQRHVGTAAIGGVKAFAGTIAVTGIDVSGIVEGAGACKMAEGERVLCCINAFWVSIKNRRKVNGQWQHGDIGNRADGLQAIEWRDIIDIGDCEVSLVAVAITAAVGVSSMGHVVLSS